MIAVDFDYMIRRKTLSEVLKVAAAAAELNAVDPCETDAGNGDTVPAPNDTEPAPA